MSKHGLNIEQRFVLLDSDGHSRLIEGDYTREKGEKNTTDILPSFLSTEWRVVSMVPYNNSDTMLVLLEKETPGI